MELVYGPAVPTRIELALFWLLALALVPAARISARALARRHPAYVQNVVIAGAGDIGQLLARKILHHPEYGINLLGFVDADPKERRNGIHEVPILGDPEELTELVRTLDVDRVILAFSNDRNDRALELVRSLREICVQVDIVPRLFDAVGPKATIHSLEGLPLVGLPRPRLSRSSAFLKRCMDVVLASVALAVLAPVFAVIAALIRWDSPGPALFRQIRVGSQGNQFRILKFRTMTADADERKSDVAHLNKHAVDGGDSRMFKIPCDPRVTRVGQFLRRYSLDELPQLVNVVKGEMTLVGPRPLIPEEDVHVSDWARKRCDLKPGITGLWQVLGRDDIEFAEMVKLDYMYVIDWGLLTDVKLMLRTVPVLCRRRATH
jgi:exopolysaccharide biosynthesis polyprenyl glycosylphosphotransferase